METIDKPEILDENQYCNIIAQKDAVISKLIVQNGTARVNVGDEVHKGDLLVEGVMEGEHTGVRQVHAKAIVLGKIKYEKEKSENLIQEIENETGNTQNKLEINLKKFKIILPKRLPKFKIYDTIITKKEIRLFSDYYLPISFSKITYKELEKNTEEYEPEELIEKMKKELGEGIIKENNLKDADIEELLETNIENNIVTVKVTYIVQEDISTKENLN